MKSVLVALLLMLPVLNARAQEAAPQTPLPPPPPTTEAPPVAPPAVTTSPQVATPGQAGAPGQEGAVKGYAVDIRRLSVAPKIDGKLDDVVWQEANLLDNFIQIEPLSGQPATQRTEVRVGYDAENLYFGVRCFDSEPGKIVGSSRSADASLASDDTISIILDTFHDRRNGFLFIVNPIGAKTDGLIRNEGEEVNTDWNGLWRAVTSRDSQGWTAEIAIPFRTLRFPSGKAMQDWGFNVRRFVARTQESTLWRPIARRPGNLTPYLISEYGEIRGLSELGGSGGRYQLVPYGIARAG
ncbi:MAG TPA: carbohydrate binding family 9 domain-containing protein, partial [Thermoanaerobaculia bacterium]